MKNAKGETLGSVTLRETAAGVELSGNLKGLPPGKHGLHFHQVGKCEAPEFTTAGPHYNPDKKSHGQHNPAGPHKGDLGNITVGTNGNVSLKTVGKGVTLKAGPASLLQTGGTSLMIHATEDDEKTDPSGNSGARIACGVITAPASH
ncbi:MAG TPA: superoxide dismutase family protein [Bryobacteraceae bacterium]|nr:superoxide dismutase family protein [Bryobacteraceae bacterium]